MGARLPEPDAVSPKSTIELGDRHELGTFQSATMASRTRPEHVHGDGDRGTHGEDGHPTPDGGLDQVGERLIAIDPVVQERMKWRMSVPLVLPDQRAIAREDRRVGELEGHAAAARCRRDFVVQCQSTAGAIDDVEEPVPAGAREPETRDEPAPEVR